MLVAERGEELFDRLDAEAALSRALEYVGVDR